ncbi:MAG: adenylate/guanylate cyclase domain-containing protein [Spirochaetota bacterium]
MLPSLLNSIRDIFRQRAGSTSPAVAEVFAREEVRGSRALLYFRFGVVLLLIVGGLSAPARWQDKLANMFFAAAYAAVVAVQMYLHRCNNSRALHRFSYFSLLADHAVFTFQILFYYQNEGMGNFNFAMKSPYVVLLLMPTLTTLLQFRFSLLVFSLATSITILLGFFGFALLSRVPQSSSWHQYFLGETIILPAWLGLWMLLPTFTAALIAYSIRRSRRMVAEIGQTENQKRQLARYFSPAVVEEIAAAGDQQSMRGERRQVAVLFADIRSFTSLSEHLPPDEIAAMLSELRQLQISAVFRFGGTVDKFIGDALMAVFGAPKSSGSFAQDIYNSVACALAILNDLEAFNARRSAAGKESIRIGIGIHAGEVFAGNLGSEDQLEYTVIGDVVNTASRIEHLCKKAQAEFLVSETVARELPANVVTERLGVVKIRGREQPMGIYRVNR